MKIFQAGLKQAMALGVIALVMGGLGGCAGAVLSGSLDGMAAVASYAYLALLVLFPLALLAMTTASLEEESRPLYATAEGALSLLLLAGLFGSAIGSAFFFVPATNVMALLKGQYPAKVQQALFAHISWASVGLVIAVTTGVALLLAGWAHKQVKAKS